MADALEAAWQGVQQEAADELVRVKRHDLQMGSPLTTAILVAEGDAIPVMGDEAAVRYGYAMGIASEIGQHGFRACKGRLGVDAPALLPDRRVLALEQAPVRARTRVALDAPSKPSRSSTIARSSFSALAMLSHSPLSISTTWPGVIMRPRRLTMDLVMLVKVRVTLPGLSGPRPCCALGSNEATSWPGRISSIGFVEPSAMRMGVPARKQRRPERSLTASKFLRVRTDKQVPDIDLLWFDNPLIRLEDF